MSDIIDLEEFRERKRAANSERGRVEIKADPDAHGNVQFRFSGPGFDSDELTIPARGALTIGNRFIEAAREAKLLTKPACRFCGAHGCYAWHEGMLVSYKGRLPHTVARVVRVCKTTVRLREVESGREYYVSRHTVMWRRCDEQLDLLPESGK